jgi:hypothetical protein
MNEKIIIDYIEMVAERTANIVLKKLSETGVCSGSVSNVSDEWVDTKGAAKIIGVTPNYMRSIKDKFNWKKSWRLRTWPCPVQSSRTHKLLSKQ